MAIKPTPRDPRLMNSRKPIGLAGVADVAKKTVGRAADAALGGDLTRKAREGLGNFVFGTKPAASTAKRPTDALKQVSAERSRQQHRVSARRVALQKRNVGGR